MVFDIDSITKTLKNIDKEKDKLNEELKQTITNICDKDITQQTKEIKYSMYDGKEREYQIQNDKYKELISGFSDAYLSMSDFYVGPELHRETYLDSKKDVCELFTLFIIAAISEPYINAYHKKFIHHE